MQAAVASPNFWDTLDPYAATGLVMDDRPLSNGSGIVNPGPPSAAPGIWQSGFWLPSNPMFWAAGAIGLTALAMGLSSGRVGARVSERANLGPLAESAEVGSKKESTK